MKIIIILLLSIKQACFFELNLTNRINKELIANGEVYDAKKYPFLVFIEATLPLPDGNGFSTISCTGSLVKEFYVLTAAHCLYTAIIQGEDPVKRIDKNLLLVYLGSKLNQISRKVAETHVPDAFINYTKNKNKSPVMGDIGVIKLQKPFKNVKHYIQIGGKPADFENNKAIECTCIGFGLIDATITDLRGRMMTTSITHGRNACIDHDGIDIPLRWRDYLCATAGSLTMICPGDSGGPIICNGKLYGVCSFFFNYAKNGITECDPVANKTKKEKKVKKKNSGNLIKPHLILQTILTILLYSVLTIILK